MKTNTITTIVLVGVVAFSLGACSKSEAPKTNVESPTPKIAERTETPQPPKQQQPTVPTPEQEAVALAEKKFSETWAQVGDSWFIFHQWRAAEWMGYESKVIQIRGVTFQGRSEAVSEADTLNGVKWKGAVQVYFNVFRDYELEEHPTRPARQWSEWRNAKDMQPFGEGDKRLVVADRNTLYTFANKNGQWGIAVPSVDEHYKLTKPSEEQIKKILPQ